MNALGTQVCRTAGLTGTGSSGTFPGMSAPEKNYKDTILLPETGFPMRGDLTKNEPVRLKKWEDTGLYERILSRRMAQGAPRFLLHDGPPSPTEMCTWAPP